MGDLNYSQSALVVQLTDESNGNLAGVDASNSLYVGGKSAVGSSPSSNPVYISGIDPSGLKRGLQTDTAGRLIVTTPTASSSSNVFSFNSSIAVNVSNMWRRILSYTIPTGYTFNLTRMTSMSSASGEQSRIIREINFGSYNLGTNVYTDAFDYTGNLYASKIEINVTTALSAGATTVYITYTNQDGVVGRVSGNVAVASAAGVGYRYSVPLAAGDYGAKDVTLVTENPATATTGVINIVGVDEFCVQNNFATGTLYVDNFASGVIIAKDGTQGGTIGIDINSSSGQPRTRQTDVLYVLVSNT